MSDETEARDSKNSYKFDGLGTYTYAGYEIDIGIDGLSELAVLKLLFNGEVILEADSILSISNMYESADEKCEIICFILYDEIIDQRNRGTLYTIIRRGEQITHHSIRVDNTAAPIIYNGNIFVVESLKLVSYPPSLKRILSETLIITTDFLSGDFDYLDTYAISKVILLDHKLYLQYSSNAFKKSYYWYTGKIPDLKKKSLILLDN
ncbi:MAG: hypothetical protein AAF693_19675 [Bacteroidota bacterium]